MLSLRNILPPRGKFESTVKGLKMFSYSHYHLMEVSHHVRLGGLYSQTLRGPTPRDLVMQTLQTPGYILISPPQPLPDNAVLDLPGTPLPGNPAHWLQWWWVKYILSSPQPIGWASFAQVRNMMLIGLFAPRINYHCIHSSLAPIVQISLSGRRITC